jgi:hypothetical protein
MMSSNLRRSSTQESPSLTNGSDTRRKASFRRAQEIPNEFYHEYSQQLLDLTPRIQRIRNGTPFELSDFFNRSMTEPKRVSVKINKHSYLFPYLLQRKFTQSYESEEKVEQVQKDILLYFNAYFFPSLHDSIPLFRSDGEGIFTGEVDLLISGLKESLRRSHGLSTMISVTPSPRAPCSSSWDHRSAPLHSSASTVNLRSMLPPDPLVHSWGSSDPFGSPHHTLDIQSYGIFSRSDLSRQLFSPHPNHDLGDPFLNSDSSSLDEDFFSPFYDDDI